MKLYAPKYYQKFQCIADKCNHSCCIGWEIDIDKNTLNKYNTLSNEYAYEINKSIDFSDSPHFKLCLNERCPHLNESGLCKIILNCGEEYISDICREHPRFYNYTNHGKEVGIGMSCEAACELIINSNDFDQIIEIGDVSGEITKYEFDATKYRDIVFKILKDEALEIDGKVEMIYDYFDVCLPEFSFANVLSKLEYLNDEHKTIFSKAKKLSWNTDFSNELSRIIAYYVYRHCTESYDFDDFYASLSFSIFCAGLVSTIAVKDNLCEVARIVSEEIEYSEENTELIKSLFY